jgi:acetyl esterase/lipase
MERRVNEQTPPTFMVVATDDPTVPVENTLLYAQALAKAHRPFTLKVLEHGGHGFGATPANGADSDWLSDWALWMNERLAERNEQR